MSAIHPWRYTWNGNIPPPGWQDLKRERNRPPVSKRSRPVRGNTSIPGNGYSPRLCFRFPRNWSWTNKPINFATLSRQKGRKSRGTCFESSKTISTLSLERDYQYLPEKKIRGRSGWCFIITARAKGMKMKSTPCCNIVWLSSNPEPFSSRSIGTVMITSHESDGLAKL